MRLQRLLKTRAFVHIELLKVLNIVVLGHVFWGLKNCHILECKGPQLSRVVAASAVLGMGSFGLQVFQQKVLAERNIARSDTSAEGLYW
jgi:hypothetical protein